MFKNSINKNTINPGLQTCQSKENVPMVIINDLSKLRAEKSSQWYIETYPTATRGDTLLISADRNIIGTAIIQNVLELDWVDFIANASHHGIHAEKYSSIKKYPQIYAWVLESVHLKENPVPLSAICNMIAEEENVFHDN